jgi:uncharacterized RDD family membrane protein YckC
LVYCWKCGSESRDEAAYCPKCGASLRGTMGVPSPTGLELLRDDHSVRNHWARRVIAFLIDLAAVSAVVAVVSVAIAVPLLIGSGFPTSTSTFPAWWAAWWGAWLGGVIPVILFLYFFFAEGFYARTLGKYIMGLRVERLDGRRVDFRDSVVRNISKIYWLLLIVDVLVGLGMHGESTQKWSDRFIGTKVEAKTQMTILP